MHVLVAHNTVAPHDAAADLDVLTQVEAVSEALRSAGCALDTQPVSLNLNDFRIALAAIQPDVVFNLVESLAGYDRLAPLAPAMMESLEYRCTGSPAQTLSLLSDKVRAKAQMRCAGLPTADWVVNGTLFQLPQHGRPMVRSVCESPAEAEVPLCHLRESTPNSRPAPERYIIKPIHDHASYGIHADSVISVVDEHALHIALAERGRCLGRSCFAERFIDGREFNLSILAGPNGPEVLPPAEILFVDFPVDEPRIVHYAAKWEPEPPGYRNTPRRFDFPDSDRLLLKELTELTEACWHLFGIQGYARVDFRVAPDGSPWILEVNANPCLSPDAGFAAAVERAGHTFREAMGRIIADALSKHRQASAIARVRPAPAC